MLGKTTKPIFTLPPIINTGLKRGEFALQMVMPHAGTPIKSDFVGGLVRQMHADGKITDQQLEDFYKKRLEKMAPFGL